MADFVHLTPGRNAKSVIRSGIGARSRGWAEERGVYAMPVLESFTLTHQWVRELRRWQQGVLVAVDVRLADDTGVLVGRYGQEPERVTAAEAVGLIKAIPEPLGYEVFVPRAVTAAEVRRVRSVSQGIGWRHWPAAHGAKPCGCPACLQPGTPGAAKLRRRYAEDDD